MASSGGTRKARREISMNKLMTSAAVLVACGGCFLAGQVFAQDEGGNADGGGGFPVPAWAQMGAEQEAFKKSVGTWDVHTKMWMAPGQPPMEGHDKATSTLLFDGRYLETMYEGSMMGQSFTGRLLLGYDRVDKEYVSVWIDSGSTYISVSRGPEKDGVITLAQNDPDWMTGKKKPTEMVLKWTNDNEYVLTFQEKGADGANRTTMEFTYTRQTTTGDK
jgi:hypothetical protein